MMRSAELARYGASPRENTVQRAAQDFAKEDVSSVSRWQKYKQPLPMMMQIFGAISDRDEEYWLQVAPFFKRVELTAGTVLYVSESMASGFYLVESGVLRADYDLEQGQLYESILAGTTCGELPFFSQTTRTATVRAECDSVVWKLDRDSWDKLRALKPNGAEIANEILVLALKLTVERFTSVTAYVLMAAS
jgi:SulP family sulfate permease